MNVNDFIKANNLNLNGEQHNLYFKKYRCLYYYADYCGFLFMGFYHEMESKSFQVTLSPSFDEYSIELYKSESPFYDTIYSNNFSSISVENIKELILFCRKLLKNKVFL